MPKPKSQAKPKAPESDSPAPESGQGSEAKGWLAVLTTLARSVPAPIAGLVLVALVGFAQMKDRLGETLVWVVVAIVAVVTLAYFYFYSRAFKQEETLRDEVEARARSLEATRNPTPSNEVWSRLQLKLDLPEKSLPHFRGRLEEVQAVAFTWLSKNSPGLKPDSVRANIMLPDNRRASYGELCYLYIPKSLHVNMDDAPDRVIRFDLTQGIVGKVYSSNIPGAALFENGEWKRVFFGEKEPKELNRPDFELTEWQKKLIHPDLKWVLSAPLLHPDADHQARALGVLNIDGIANSLSDDTLRQLWFHVTEKVTVVAAELGELPKQRLSILQIDTNA